MLPEKLQETFGAFYDSARRNGRRNDGKWGRDNGHNYQLMLDGSSRNIRGPRHFRLIWL
jgi:hypothetical protein